MMDHEPETQIFKKCWSRTRGIVTPLIPNGPKEDQAWRFIEIGQYQYYSISIGIGEH